MGNTGGPSPSQIADAEGGVPIERIPLHSTNLLTVLDAEGIIRYESPSIERIFGFDPDALVGEPVAELFHPADREAVLAAFRRVVTAEEDVVESVEYRHEHADGSYRWVESVASSNPTPEGFYVVNTRDISARKDREQALQRSNEQLHEFASVVSHDLRSPLSVATAHLDLLSTECESDHVDAIERAHRRMDELIDDLLSLAREGKQVSEPEPVDLAAVARRAWDQVWTAAATLETAPVEGFLADRSRLQQLLENLFRNSVEHGGPDVTVTVGELEDGFFVADDGPGIPEADRESVFDAGYLTAEDGTGFGLSIVDQVVQAHGWDLHLGAGAEGGARFEITGVEFVEG